MLHKSFNILESKADADAGTFEATVAVFGNVDKGGDRIIPGAFEKSLGAWQASQDPIPVILSHNWGDPFHHIGVVEEAKETDRGLWVKGRLDVTDNDVARQVHRLMQRRSLKEFSFGYSVPKGGERRAKDGANELIEIDLAEVGPTLKGMNPQTELHAVKSAVVEQTLQSELREVKTRLDELEKRLDTTKTDPVQEPKVRTEDPLAEKARAAVMDVYAEGSQPPPPVTQEQPPGPDTDPEELKRRSRDLIVQLMND